jgi:pimeloyl-ACP methyl ester carboxylesterase
VVGVAFPSRLADELHATVGAAGERGPFVLVGHSLGGEVVRLYANRHPDEVAGMVLVDALSDNNDWLTEEFGWWRYGPTLGWKAAATMLLTPRGFVRLKVNTASAVSDFAQRRAKVWARIQADLASLSHNSQLIVAERARHTVQWDEPGLIIGTVTDMCAALPTEEE